MATGFNRRMFNCKNNDLFEEDKDSDWLAAGQLNAMQNQNKLHIFDKSTGHLSKSWKTLRCGAITQCYEYACLAGT